MAENKTKPTDQSVEQFIQEIPDEQKRRDSMTILELMKEVTGVEPEMWGDSIVGFGKQHYIYATGREGDWFKVGFSPRKQNLTLYLTYGFEPYRDLLEKLGKHKTGVGCLYIKKLDDIDFPTLTELVKRTVQQASQA